MVTVSREFQVFAKPVGSSCNLNCTYCYYLGKKDLYPGTLKYKMSDELLEKYIIQQIEATTDDVIMFSWHGGEPTLAGLDFYKNVVRLQKILLPEGRSIINGIQTNGTLIDDEWCSFLAEENFLVGLSIDGPGKLHNLNRRTPTGSSSFELAERGFKKLLGHGLMPEILCVVNSTNSAYPLEIYNYFKSLGARYMTFLPLVIHDKNSESGASSDSVIAEDFGRFLCSIFDEWVQNDIGKIKIQIFEEAARTAFDKEHTLCIFKVDCGGVPVVEHNGDFYSCDHFADRAHFVGNITERSLTSLLDSPEQKAFGKEKSEKLPHYCQVCNVKEMCNGECPKNRFISTPGGEPGLNYLCPGYKQFFNHCRPFVEAISVAWRNKKV